MRKERKPRQQNSGKGTMYVGITCIVLAIIYGLAYFAVFDVAPIQFANSVQLYLFGSLSFLMPFVLLFLGYLLILCDSVSFFNKKTMAFLMVMLCLLGTAHHILVPFKEELYPEQLKAGGGIVGGLVAWLMHNLLGEDGTNFFLVCVWLLIIAIALPWRSIYNLFRGMFFSPEIKEKPKKEVKVEPKEIKREAKPIKNVPVFKPENKANSIRDVYRGEEFDRFQDGIKKQSTFKRILKINDDNIYEQEPIKEEIQRNPVKVPEWVERPAQQVIIRPKINYGEEQTAIPDSGFKSEQTFQHEASKTEPEKQGENLSSLFVNNTYGKQEDFTSNASAIQTSYTDSERESMFSEVKSVAEELILKNDGATEAVKSDKVADNKVPIYDSAEKIKTAVDFSHKVEEQEGSAYKLPPLDILNMPQVTPASSYEKDIMQQCAVLEQTLADFRVRAKVIAVTRGPSVTRFELEPAPGVKVSSVVNLADDIALRLAAPGVRIEAPIPGKSAIGIEAPNTKNDPVCFREVVDSEAVRNGTSSLCIGLGKDISGNIIPADLSKMPHLLVAGSTGSGKSVCINTIIAGILYKARPEDVKLILVDPKVVELSNYNGIPHLLTPVVTEPKKAASALHWAVAEMERRYQTFADNHVRDINSYNAQAPQKMPFIVIIIDELSDLMMVAKVDVEDAILRLAQKARAAGIHLILATQRPSVDVITGIVKANIPSRIAFAVSSQTDSRTIIDMGGAEKLLGKGDMLFYPIGMNKPVRVQGAFVSDAELNRIVDFIIKQSIPVNYTEEVTEQELECDGKSSDQDENSNSPMNAEDELFEDAVKLVLDMGQASSSMLQRRFRIGYTRAARLVDTMEEMGIVGQAVGSKPREVIMSRQEVEERFLRKE